MPAARRRRTPQHEGPVKAILHTQYGAGADKYADYFEMCRRKRNVIDYTRAQVATDTETAEIVEKAAEFYEFVEAWIDSKFPNLKR